MTSFASLVSLPFPFIIELSLSWPMHFPFCPSCSLPWPMWGGRRETSTLHECSSYSYSIAFRGLVGCWVFGLFWFLRFRLWVWVFFSWFLVWFFVVVVLGFFWWFVLIKNFTWAAPKLYKKPGRVSTATALASTKLT